MQGARCCAVPEQRPKGRSQLVDFFLVYPKNDSQIVKPSHTFKPVFRQVETVQSLH